MDEQNILSQVNELVAEEHELRSRAEAGEISAEEERARLHALEESLDQCWDLLRQRRARREFGQNPDDAKARDVGEVEHYLQ
jgi:hypothetical protein